MLVMKMQISEISLVILLILIWGIQGLISKMGVNAVGKEQMLFFGQLLYFIVPVIFLYLSVKNFSSLINLKSYLPLVYGFLGGLGAIIFFFILEKGKASIVVPLTAIYPALTAILAILVLREQVNTYNLVGIAFAVIAGVLLSL